MLSRGNFHAENSIVTKFCHLTLRGPVIMSYRVYNADARCVWDNMCIGTHTTPVESVITCKLTRPDNDKGIFFFALYMPRVLERRQWASGHGAHAAAVISDNKLPPTCVYLHLTGVRDIPLRFRWKQRYSGNVIVGNVTFYDFCCFRCVSHCI